MKSFTPPPVPDNIVDDLRQLKASGVTQERMIEEMRTRGLHKVESIRVYRALYGASLREAHVAVHDSSTWADRREVDEALQNAMCDALVELGGEESEDGLSVTYHQDLVQHAH